MELTSAQKVNTSHTPRSSGVMGEKEVRWIWLTMEGTRAAHTPTQYGMRPCFQGTQIMRACTSPVRTGDSEGDNPRVRKLTGLYQDSQGGADSIL